MNVFQRAFWINSIENSWRDRSIIWLQGVRRSGKTVLARCLPNTEYFDCELPRVRQMMEDSQSFLSGLPAARIVLDEIHRLPNPSELLKIAADHYPDIQILATGSSTLGASHKFRDTLAGRKHTVWLTPMISADMDNFSAPDISHRLLRGGLPPFFLAPSVPERDFQEWIDAYWAKDIQELFRLERRSSFQRFAELLFMNSGGIFEATRFTRPCEVSRTTISNYLGVLEDTFVVNVIRPFSTHRPTEIVSAPKVYAFDTGFVCYFRGWYSLRSDDYGLLWEHFVLNELHAHLQSRAVNYWRDKRGHEVDFVLRHRGQPPTAIECKWSPDNTDISGLKAFRRQYPEGKNYVVAHTVDRPFSRSYGQISVTFLNCADLISSIR